MSFTLRNISKVSSLVLAVVCCAIFSAAQTGSDEIRIDTELASFEVSVTDAKGAPVRGLSAKDFRIFENGKERGIDFFQPIKKRDASRPLSLVFALDVSGSMTEAELEKLRGSMDKFVKRLADYESQFAVLSFAMDVKTNQEFTNRPDRIEQSLRKLKRDQDGLSTHAYDAVDYAVRMIARKSPKAIKDRIPRRAVILITDGFPVGDIVSSSTVIERANDAEASIFSVLLPSYSRLQRDGRRILTPLEASGLSERTGGISITAVESNFDRIFEALAEELTASYAIAFYPPEGEGPGERQVKIESRSGLLVRQNRTTYKPAN
ncbi:MAG TPA: VWA domain-containing protein [Pyrinomonadaceae bacterium]|nr:VWA domain-containing protein [Pyrinomonadaceae bacterium]